MRDFLSERNLVKAALLSGLITVLALPRLLDYGRYTLILSSGMFLLSLFMAGAVTAWGKRGGLSGPWPDQAFCRRAVAVAVIAGLVFSVLLKRWVDPWIYGLLEQAGAEERLAMSFPEGPGAIGAMILWGIGFELLFFQAAPMSTLVRIIPLRKLAVGASVLLRLYVVSRQAGTDGLDALNPLLYAAPLAVTLTAALLYSRHGWPTTALFILIIDLRHFF